MNPREFGLYPTPELVAGQRLAAGAMLALQRPVQADGVTLFRSSCWLPVPASIAGAASLVLAPAQLALRFSPARFDVALSDRGWFPRVDNVDASTLKIEFAWPAEVVSVPRRPGRARHELKLYRADGDAVAQEPTQSGRNGVDLDPAWVGSPLVLEVGNAVHGLEDRAAFGTLAAAPRAIVGSVGSTSIDKVDTALIGTARSAVAALTLAGRPSSPRLSLYAERDGDAATLLWQALLPGEHDSALLPGAPLDAEWAGALEQLRAMSDGASGLPERLRLDLESDAPCELRFEALQLGLHAVFELLDSPRTIAFDGKRAQSEPLALDVPDSVAAQRLHVTGRLAAGVQADAGAASASAHNLGALLDADHAALQPVALAAPVALAGLAFDWLPLSSRLQLLIRVLADGGARPGARVLATATTAFETAQPARLVARWPAVDLQAQTLWIEATPLAGAGLWPFADASAAAPGWTETKGAQPQRDTLPQALRLQLLGAAEEGSATRPVAVRLDGHVLIDALPTGRFEIEVPASLLPSLATLSLVFEASIRAGVTIESARLETAL